MKPPELAPVVLFRLDRREELGEAALANKLLRNAVPMAGLAERPQRLVFIGAGKQTCVGAFERHGSLTDIGQELPFAGVVANGPAGDGADLGQAAGGGLHESLINAVAHADGLDVEPAGGHLGEGLGELLGILGTGLVNRVAKVSDQFKRQGPAGAFQGGSGVEAGQKYGGHRLGGGPPNEAPAPGAPGLCAHPGGPELGLNFFGFLAQALALLPGGEGLGPRGLHLVAFGPELIKGSLVSGLLLPGQEGRSLVPLLFQLLEAFGLGDHVLVQPGDDVLEFPEAGGRATRWPRRRA